MKELQIGHLNAEATKFYPITLDYKTRAPNLRGDLQILGLRVRVAGFVFWWLLKFLLTGLFAPEKHDWHRAMNYKEQPMSLIDQPTKKLIMVHDGTTTTLHSDILGKELELTANGVCMTDKPEVAAEMEEKYLGHVITATYPLHTPPRGRVLFTMPELPWKRKRAEADDATATP